MRKAVTYVVKMPGESSEALIRRFNRKVQEDRVLQDEAKHRAFVKPSTIRREAKQKSVREHKKRQAIEKAELERREQMPVRGRKVRDGRERFSGKGGRDGNQRVVPRTSDSSGARGGRQENR